MADSLCLSPALYWVTLVWLSAVYPAALATLAGMEADSVPLNSF